MLVVATLAFAVYVVRPDAARAATMLLAVAALLTAIARLHLGGR